MSSVGVVGVEVAEDDAPESAFEAAKGFGGGIAGCESVPVVGLAESVTTDLGDGDAMQDSVELTVLRAAKENESQMRDAPSCP